MHERALTVWIQINFTVLCVSLIQPTEYETICRSKLHTLIHNTVVSNFNDNKLYAECWLGFRHKRTCLSQPTEVIDDITKLLDQGKSVDLYNCTWISEKHNLSQSLMRD